MNIREGRLEKHGHIDHPIFAEEGKRFCTRSLSHWLKSTQEINLLHGGGVVAVGRPTTN